MKFSKWFLFLISLSFFLPLPHVGANETQNQTAIMKQVRIENKLGAEIPLDLPFLDEQGRSVKLSDYFGTRPVLIMPVYYECPMLCGVVFKGFIKAAKIMKFTPGQEFDIVTFSINPEEKPELAQKKKDSILREYGRPEAAKGWHFLTAQANSNSIEILTKALGFHYAYDESSKEYAHPALVLALTPQGKIARYFSGIEFSPKDMQFAIIEASGGKVGSFFDQILLLCYHYDPMTGKYGLVISRIMKMLGILTVTVLLTFIFLSLRDERSKAKAGR